METTLTQNSGFFQIVEVSGTPFYGYHPREHRFFKVTSYPLIQGWPNVLYFDQLSNACFWKAGSLKPFWNGSHAIPL